MLVKQLNGGKAIEWWSSHLRNVRIFWVIGPKAQDRLLESNAGKTVAGKTIECWENS